MKRAFVGLAAILGNQCCMDAVIVCGHSVRIVAKYSALQLGGSRLAYLMRDTNAHACV
jgi:hypothetical protein